MSLRSQSVPTLVWAGDSVQIPHFVALAALRKQYVRVIPRGIGRIFQGGFSLGNFVNHTPQKTAPTVYLRHST